MTEIKIDKPKYVGSHDLYTETEIPGQRISLDAYKIICFRYLYAAKLVKNKDALEVGCGPAIGFNLLNTSAKRFVCVEYSEENITLARKYKKTINSLVRSNAHKLPFKNNSFDIVIALAMIYYLDIELFLKEAKRLLKNKGELFFCMSNKDVPGFVQPPFTTEYYSVPDLDNILKKNGFNAQYFGAFPAARSLIYLKYRAYLKNIAKILVNILPYGERLWRGLRARTRGKYISLPDNIQEQEADNVKLEILDRNKINNIHRIIFVRCKRID